MNPETNPICDNPRAAVAYWRKNAARAAASTCESLFMICLDNDRYFTACHEVETKVFNSPALLADEIMGAECLNGAEEFIFLHWRPGTRPEADSGSRARCRALILAARKQGCKLLDYIIVGKSDERFHDGYLGLAHFKRSFNSEDPFPPKAARQIKTKK